VNWMGARAAATAGEAKLVIASPRTVDLHRNRARRSHTPAFQLIAEGSAMRALPIRRNPRRS
jgi:hypothetical protein